MAICFGQEPATWIPAGMFLPYGRSEYDLAGALRGAPVEVILGEETGLPLPAHAEIVIEGEALPTERRDEGPFGEWTGYYASDVRPEPVIRVKRLMHRNDPILLGSPPGKPPSELTAYRAILRSALIWDQMEAAGGHAQVTVDLEAQAVTAPGGQVFAFRTPATLRRMLLEGLDEVEFILGMREQIEAFRRADAVKRPWVYQPGLAR